MMQQIEEHVTVWTAYTSIFVVLLISIFCSIKPPLCQFLPDLSKAMLALELWCAVAGLQ